MRSRHLRPPCVLLTEPSDFGKLASRERHLAPARINAAGIDDMNALPTVGTVGRLDFIVEPKHAIDFADQQMPAVLSTPWLIWFLEHAAREAVLPFLRPDESTVGVEVEVQHLAPTPLGQSVQCEARVVRINGRELWFQLQARDPSERIATGFHKLRVIQKQRFAAHVSKKSSGAV